MNLYDVVPENLFSILASKNKGLYAKALFVLLEAFKRQLKIQKTTLTAMISSKLEDEILTADFSEEALLDTEQSFSGKAHFLVRKLKATGWILVETEADFEEYITLPSYSIKIIQLLYELTHMEAGENFAYVYSTYSSLRTADESRNVFEMVTALYDGAHRTEKLVESIKAVYHNITYYHQQQIDMMNVNNVLDSHYTQYREEVVAKILRPLKIKDSVPKYRVPLAQILKKWLADEEALSRMGEYLTETQKVSSAEEAHMELITKIHYILEVYDGLERDYIRAVDAKNTQYTRATTQKIDYLINSDQTVKGNLITILKAISADAKNADLLSDSFELYQCLYLAEESLFERKKSTVRTKIEPVVLAEEDLDFQIRAKAEALQLLNSRYGKKQVNAFVENLFGEREEFCTDEIEIPDDETYILTLLSAVQATDRNSPYSVQQKHATVACGPYQIPLMTYRKKKRV